MNTSPNGTYSTCCTTSPYLFNAKELDEETGLYYYGARYYDPRVSIWLSADPMQEKYPDVSTYAYCANNPVNRIDPNGNDDYEINQKGYVTWKNESDIHTLHAVDAKGKRTWASIAVKDRKILDDLSTNSDSKIHYSTVGQNDKDDVFKTFLFAAENTDVEWVVHKSDDDGIKYTIGTKHNEETTGRFSEYNIKNRTATLHSHPDVDTSSDKELFSMGFYWWDRKKTKLMIVP